MNNFFSKIAHYLDLGIWEKGFRGEKKEPFHRKAIKTMIMSIEGFRVDRCSTTASALAYYSLLALVPILALAFGIARGFHLDRYVEQELLAQFARYEIVIQEAISFAKRLLEQTRGGIIAAVGLAILLWTVAKVLNYIESAFNRIWLVRKGRSFKRKFTDYISVAIVCPILVILSNAAAVLAITRIQQYTRDVPLIGVYADWLLNLINIVPFMATWALLAFLYVFIPNVPVRLKTGLIAAFIAAIVYHFFQWAYVFFQIGIARYGAIYGSFAAFPLFLIWLQISWMIVLFGAEISYSLQNLGVFGLKQSKAKINIYNRRLLLLGIMRLLVKNFHNKENPLSSKEIAKSMGIPLQVCTALLNDLVDCHLAVSAIDGRQGYQPAIDISGLTLADVIKAVEKQEETTIKMVKSKEMHNLAEILSEFEKIIENSPKNSLLKDL